MAGGRETRLELRRPRATCPRLLDCDAEHRRQSGAQCAYGKTLFDTALRPSSDGPTLPGLPTLASRRVDRVGVPLAAPCTGLRIAGVHSRDLIAQLSPESLAASLRPWVRHLALPLLENRSTAP